LAGEENAGLVHDLQGGVYDSAKKKLGRKYQGFQWQPQFPNFHSALTFIVNIRTITYRREG